MSFVQKFMENSKVAYLWKTYSIRNLKVNFGLPKWPLQKSKSYVFEPKESKNNIKLVNEHNKAVS